MKTSTYGFLVLLAYLKHYDKPFCPSIAKLIERTDELCKILDCKQTLTYMSKYTVIKELIKNDLLQQSKKANKYRLNITMKLRKHIDESFHIIIRR